MDLTSACGQHLEIFCVDIGSEAKGRLGWAKSTDPAFEGTGLQTLADEVTSALVHGSRVALGFECPLFVPIYPEPARLTSARVGEGSRPWSAGAGAGALAIGLTQVVWVLRALKSQLQASVPATLNWTSFEREGGLFLWEAFVSAGAKAEGHAADALVAIHAFETALPDPTTSNAIQAHDVHSLIGAAMLRTGWASDLAVLAQPCLVIRA